MSHPNDGLYPPRSLHRFDELLRLTSGSERDWHDEECAAQRELKEVYVGREAMRRTLAAEDARAHVAARPEPGHVPSPNGPDAASPPDPGVLDALRAAVTYARDRRGSAFDWDMWRALVDAALAGHGVHLEHDVHLRADRRARTRRDLLRTRRRRSRRPVGDQERS